MRRDVVDEMDRVCNSFDFRLVSTFGLSLFELGLFDVFNLFGLEGLDTDRASDPLLTRLGRCADNGASSEIDRMIFFRGTLSLDLSFDFVVFVHFVLFDEVSDIVGVRERNDFLFESFAVHTFSRQILSRPVAADSVDLEDFGYFADFDGFEFDGAQSP